MVAPRCQFIASALRPMMVTTADHLDRDPERSSAVHYRGGPTLRSSAGWKTMMYPTRPSASSSPSAVTSSTSRPGGHAAMAATPVGSRRACCALGIAVDRYPCARWQPAQPLPDDVALRGAPGRRAGHEHHLRLLGLRAGCANRALAPGGLDGCGLDLCPRGRGGRLHGRGTLLFLALLLIQEDPITSLR